MYIFKIYKDGPKLHCFPVSIIVCLPSILFQYYYVICRYSIFILSVSLVQLAILLCCVLIHSVESVSVALWAVAHQAPLSVGILQAKILEWVAMPSSRGRPNPRIEPRSPALQMDSLSSCHQGSP